MVLQTIIIEEDFLDIVVAVDIIQVIEAEEITIIVKVIVVEDTIIIRIVIEVVTAVHHQM